MAENKLLAELVAACRWIGARGWSPATGGNMSQRRDAHSCFITIHAFLYRRFPEVSCVLHTHSVSATVLSRAEQGSALRLFSHYFDTRGGAKRQSAAYQAIAAELALPPAAILFLSDIYQEFDAARNAGWRTCQLIRDDHCASGSHPQARRFDEITLQEFV